MKYLTYTCLFILGLFSFVLFTNMDKQKEMPKKLPLQNVFSGKARTAFSNKIEVLEYKNQKALLKATVTRRSSNESFSYHWHLPDNVQVIRGDVTGNILDTTSKQYVFNIEIAWSDWIEGRMLFFKIKSSSNLGRTAVWYPQEDLKDESALIGLQKASEKKKVKLPDWIKVMQ